MANRQEQTALVAFLVIFLLGFVLPVCYFDFQGLSTSRLNAMPVCARTMVCQKDTNAAQ